MCGQGGGGRGGRTRGPQLRGPSHVRCANSPNPCAPVVRTRLAGGDRARRPVIGGALAYALGHKNVATVNVEFYTGIDERLDVPVELPPGPQPRRRREPAGVHPRRRRRLLVRRWPRDGQVRARGARGARRRARRKAALDRPQRLRVASHRSLDRLPVVGRTADRERATPALTATLVASEGEYPAQVASSVRVTSSRALEPSRCHRP